jgi:chromosome segregation ATPase
VVSSRLLILLDGGTLAVRMRALEDLMSLFDKVTKAVGDVVDRGKKEADQFVRIQRIKGEISDLDKKVSGFKTQIEQAKVAAGSKAIELLRAGTLASPDLKPFLDQIVGLEEQVAAEEAAIAEKRADIEKIKAEDEAAPEAAAAEAVPPVATAPAAPAAPAASKFCSQCGATLTGGQFCPQCGAKQG